MAATLADMFNNCGFHQDQLTIIALQAEVQALESRLKNLQAERAKKNALNLSNPLNSFDLDSPGRSGPGWPRLGHGFSAEKMTTPVPASHGGS